MRTERFLVHMTLTCLPAKIKFKKNMSGTNQQQQQQQRVRNPTRPNRREAHLMDSISELVNLKQKKQIQLKRARSEVSALTEHVERLQRVVNMETNTNRMLVRRLDDVGTLD